MARLNIVFVSALQHPNGRELPDILETVLRCKPSNSLRCMLLFSAGHLMQAIDGETMETRCELQRLLSAPQYRDSVVLNEALVQAPSLDCTSLGALHLPSAVIARIPPAVALFTLTESAISQRVREGFAHNLLKQFASDYAG